MPEFLQALWSPIQNVVGFVVGAVALHFWSRFRTRLVQLRWTSDVQHLARSTTEPGLGTIEVLRNGQPVDNLFVATAQVTNDSMQDVSDLELVVALRDKSVFLQHSAQLEGSLKFLVFSADFARVVDQVMAVPENERDPASFDSIRINRAFAVPALNRGQSIDLWFLIHAPADVEPELLFSTDHVGVKLRQRPPRKATLGVRDDYAAAVGLLVGLIAVISSGLTDRVPVWSSLGFLLLGSMALIVGVLLIHMWRLFVRLMG